MIVASLLIGILVVLFVFMAFVDFIVDRFEDRQLRREIESYRDALRRLG